AFACWATQLSHLDYVQRLRNDLRREFFETFIRTSVITSELWSIWTTDCDGFPHATGTTPTATTTSIWYSTGYNYTSTASLPSTSPQPTCYIEPSDCNSLLTSYSSELKALDSFTQTLTPPYYVVSTPTRP